MNFSYQGRHPPAKLAAMAASVPSSYWLTDTGASHHITSDLENLSFSHAYNGSDVVAVGSGEGLPISHIGTASLSTSSHTFDLHNILRVPSIASNLLSVHQLCKDNHCSFHFDAATFSIQDLHTGKILYKGQSENGLYPIPLSGSSVSVSSPTGSPWCQGIE